MTYAMHFLLFSVSKCLIPGNCHSKCKYCSIYSMLSIINGKHFLAEINAQKSLCNKKVLKQEKLFGS